MIHYRPALRAPHICVALAVLLCSCATTKSQERPKQHLVVISVDGMRPEEYGSANGPVPAIHDLAAHGCASEGATGVFPSVTYPTHATMLTGVLPAEHGVYANQLFDPMDATGGGWYYFADQISAPALWDLTRAAGLKSAAISWPVSVSAPVDYLIPEYRPIKSQEDVRLLRALSTPGLVAQVEKEHGAVPVPLTDAWRTKAATEIFRRYQPSMLLLHLEETDHEQHVFGPGSAEARSMLSAIDRHIAELRREVEEIAGQNNVTWMIVSDHGFQAIQKQFNPMVMLREAGLLDFEKDRVKSWRVYPRIAGGMFALVANNAKDQARAELTRAVYRRLQELAADADNGFHKIYTAEELAALGSFPDAFVAVEMGPGFTAGSNIDGPLISASHYKGMHGYGLDNPASRISLVLSGASVNACEVGLVNAGVLDIAPTAARILGLSIPNARGRVLEEATRHLKDKTRR